MVVPKKFIGLCNLVKESIDLNVMSFSSALLNKLLETINLESHLDLIRNTYKEKLDHFSNCLNQYFPASTSFFKPSAGFFLWVKLPDSIEGNRLMDICNVKHNIKLISGNAFTVSPTKEAEHCIRLNFSYPTIEQISKGTEIIGDELNNIYNKQKRDE